MQISQLLCIRNGVLYVADRAPLCIIPELAKSQASKGIWCWRWIQDSSVNSYDPDKTQIHMTCYYASDVYHTFYDNPKSFTAFSFTYNAFSISGPLFFNGPMVEIHI